MASDDRETFTAWAAGREGALLRTAFLLCGDRQRSEDPVQETLVKIAQRWSRLRDDNLEAYARTILVRDNISWWRRRRRETVVAVIPEERSGDESAAAELADLLGRTSP